MERPDLNTIVSFIPGLFTGKTLTYLVKNILLIVGDKQHDVVYYAIACIDLLALSFMLRLSQRLPETQIRFFQLGLLCTRRYLLVDLIDNDIQQVYREYTNT